MSTQRVGLVLAIAVIVVLAMLGTSGGSTSNTLRVAYIDVGQGDSIWLHASDGTDVLIDGGPVVAGPTVVAYLQQGGIDDVEVMVLSHAHADHVGGLIDVLQSTIPVNSVIINNQSYTSSVYQDFIAELQARGITPTPAVAGQGHTWGPLSVKVLNPQSTPTGDQNDDSVVLLVVYSQNGFLFTGDIGSSAEQTILDSGADVAAEILKVAHHGSRYSSSAAFLEATGAEVAIISVGADNPYGHPAQETLARLQAVDDRVFRTDLEGPVVVVGDGVTYEVEADYFVFLPLVIHQVTSTPTPTATHTPPPTPPPKPTSTIVPSPTATRTATPTTTSTPTEVPGSELTIGYIRYETRDEYIRLDNQATVSQNMTNWKIQSYKNVDGGCEPSDQWHTFPTGYVLDAGASVHVHSGPDATDSPPSHLKWTGRYIWHNDGDVAILYNASGGVVDTYCYGECCPYP